jgi:SAM-dependent methyltransferase
MADQSQRALSFGAVAESYDRYRSGPVPEVADWLLPPQAQVVVDLGAGTGALTRLLVGRVRQVFSIEPDARMRDVLARRCPQATALEGRGDAIPLDDGVADAVLVSSAWHWMDVEPTLVEIGRVLRPRGRLGVVWAGPDRSVRWFSQWIRRARDTSGVSAETLEALIGDADGESGGQTDGEAGDTAGRNPSGYERNRLELPAGAPYAQPEFTEIRWSRTMTIDDLVGLAGTYSRLITLPADVRTQVLQRARSWLESQPELAEAEQVELPFRAVCWRTDRLS